MHTAANQKDCAVLIQKEIASAREAGHRSVAVIAKTEAECKTLQTALPVIYPIITEREAEYEGGIIIIPVYLAKGLEFDAVIIANASRYTSEPLDVKLLYIAMTRALHRLTVVS
jgi:DNA helicase-2/ATP-dependent DNA helicase PcrA